MICEMFDTLVWLSAGHEPKRSTWLGVSGSEKKSVFSVAETNGCLQLQGDHLFVRRGTLVKRPKATWKYDLG